VRVVVLLLIAATVLLASTFKLYLKDGDYQIVREYKVEGDRVHYYSTERGQWEDIPVTLCDLQKTEAERQRTAQVTQHDAKLEDEEEKLERAQRKEMERIPMNPGAYFVDHDQVKTLEYAESTFVKDKKRSVLQKITPVPVVAGKATVQLKGEHASLVLHQDLPEFYLRLEQQDKFGIIELAPRNGVRIVENVAIAPVTNENIENTKQIEVFQRELMSGLYKVWPEKPLTPGEYALVEYVGEESDLRIWDFAYQRPAK
jgi:hypothetical protein